MRELLKAYQNQTETLSLTKLEGLKTRWKGNNFILCHMMIYPLSSHNDLVSAYEGQQVALLQKPQATMQTASFVVVQCTTWPTVYVFTLKISDRAHQVLERQWVNSSVVFQREQDLLHEASIPLNPFFAFIIWYHLRYKKEIQGSKEPKTKG